MAPSEQSSGTSRAALRRVQTAAGLELERQLARAIELVTAGAPLGEVLRAIVAAVEHGSQGLRAEIELPDHEVGPDLVVGSRPAGAPTVVIDDAALTAGTTGTPLGTLRISAREARALSPFEEGLVAWAGRIATLAVEDGRVREAAAGYRAIVERLPAVVYIADAGVAGRWHFVSPQIESMLGFSGAEFLEDPDLWARHLHPADRARVLDAETDAQERYTAADATAAEYRMYRRDGRIVWIRDDALLVRDDRGRVRWHGVLSDITVRKQAEAEVERRAAQQAVVARLGEHALEGKDLAELMTEAVTESALIMECEVGAVLELMPEGDQLLLRATFGGGEVGETRLPAGRHSQSGYALQTGRPVIVTDWDEEQRFEKTLQAQENHMRSGLAVIIEGGDRPFGVLALQSIEPRAYRAADIDFVQAIANVLADAIHRQSTEDDIRHRALHDSLTTLPNRVLFLDRLGHALARLRRQQYAPVAVLFLDIDHFKLVNDSLGHQAGDDLLMAVATSLRQAVRPGDTVARFGGDEFGILLEEIVSERDAIEVAQRIAAAFARPFVLGVTEHFVSASVGIALADDTDQAPEALIRDADAAMYRAKERGRARYELFDEDMRARAVARLRVENDLRRALERRELRLVYQPVISLRDGSIVGAEALVRWEHPERGLVAPGDFIPVAEDCGLIEPIGRWVLGEACRQTAIWHASNPDSAPITMSVNLSARQVAQQDLTVAVSRVLRTTAIDPSCLCLEITETVLLEESEMLGDTLRALRAMGVRLVLDDFGTGYSSLGYLNRLPLDALKVDRSFVDGLGVEPRDGAIVKAVVGMAQALSLTVIAEGVESQVQLAELRALDCDLAQGYLFARPMPAGELGAMLALQTSFYAQLRDSASGLHPESRAQRPGRW
jgi:diguanylate cyclase (GGDEF)-like protein/PAS domain S-box-containing protein